MANGDGGSRGTFDPGATLVVWNPVSGRPRGRRRASRIAERLRGLGYTVEATRRPLHASELAGQAVREGARALVILGGDGTLREAISAVDARVPFAFHPSGTINLFARSLGIPCDPDDWLALLESASTRRVHLARCNGSPFLSVASTGFDASVCARVSPRLKRWIQEGAYGLRALADLPRFHASEYDLFVDEESSPRFSGPLAGVVIGKGPYYGGRHRLLPAADHSDPSLELILLGGSRRRDLLRHAYGFLRGSLAGARLVTTVSARSVRVDAHPQADVQLDGETFGRTPVLFDVEPTPRRALAPPRG